MKSLVVGLGNKGSNYKTHRHNVGSEIVSKICQIKDITLIERAKYKARIGLDSNQVSYLIPNTYMNLSGQSVALFLKNKKIDLVLSAGLLYHLSNPIQHLVNCREIAKKYVIVHTKTHFLYKFYSRMSSS